MRSIELKPRVLMLAAATVLAAAPLAAQGGRGGRMVAPAAAPLKAPATFTAARMNGGIQLNWAIVDNATGYFLYRTALPNGKEALIGNLPSGKSAAFFDGEWKTDREAALYRIYAIGGDGKPGPPATVTWTPPLQQKLAAPLTKKP